MQKKDDLNEELNTSLSNVESQKKVVKRSAKREAYWREKCQMLESNETVEDEIEALMAQVATLKGQLVLKNDEIKDLRETIDELKLENIDLQNIEEVSLFDENANSYIPQSHA